MSGLSLLINDLILCLRKKWLQKINTWWWCFVPSCTNTSINSPNKLFISVPKQYYRKLRWFQAAGRDMPKSQSGFFCCEDHFDLKEDMENYMRFKLMGGNIILKRDVVPHIFVSQKKRETVTSVPENPAFTRQQRVEQTILEPKLFTSLQVGKANTSKVNEEDFVIFQTAPVKNKSILRPDKRVVIKHFNTTAELSAISTKAKYKCVGVQTIPHYCSRYTQCDSKSRIAHTASSPIKFTACKSQDKSSDTASIYYK